MEVRGTQYTIGALNIPTGNLRAAQSIYENVSARQDQNADRKNRKGIASGAYRVSISSQGQQLSKSRFERNQQQKADEFKRNEQQDAAEFNRSQQRARFNFERKERQKEAEFDRSQQQDATQFRRSQQQEEARFQRQLSRNSKPEQP